MTTTYKPVSMLFERWEMMGLPGLPFPETPAPAAPAPRLAWRQLTPGRKALLAELEKHLRANGWPYVVVDEAKKSIFANVPVKSFDFLVYRDNGPNLLVLVIARRPTADQVQQMAEWENIFGKDFQAVFVFQADGQWRMIELKDLQTPDPLAQAQSLDECLGGTSV